MAREHYKQPWPSWGCQHAAMYNLFGDPRLLNDPNNETDVYQFQKWCRSLGYDFVPLYFDATEQYPCPRHYWKTLFNLDFRRRMQGQNFALLVDVEGLAGVTAHSVAVIGHVATQSPTLGFTVHDSELSEPLEFFVMEDFVKTKYASAFAITMVNTAADFDIRMPSRPGHEQSWVSDYEKARYAQHLVDTAHYCPTCHAPDCDH